MRRFILNRKRTRPRVSRQKCVWRTIEIAPRIVSNGTGAAVNGPVGQAQHLKQPTAKSEFEPVRDEGFQK